MGFHDPWIELIIDKRGLAHVSKIIDCNGVAWLHFTVTCVKQDSLFRRIFKWLSE